MEGNDSKNWEITEKHEANKNINEYRIVISETSSEWHEKEVLRQIDG